jgi:membrane protein YdbS with pleckstrin-like domain
MSSEEVSPSQRVAQMAMKGSNTNAEAEEKLWEGGYSPKAMLGTWLLCIVLSVLAIAGMVMFPQMFGSDIDPSIIRWVGIGILITGWTIAIAMYAYRRIGVRYELTTQRFIHRHGILMRTTDRIELIDIDDVAFTQGLIQRMLNVGTIRVSSSDRSHPILNLLGIDDVARVSNLIDDARRKERRKRSLHIESA